MKQVYNILDAIKGHLENDTNVNHVSFGDFKSIDTSKTTIFPVSHFWMNKASMEGSTIKFTIDLMCLDVVDESKEYENTFYGSNNLQDVLNTQLQVVNSLIESVRSTRGALAEQQYVLVNNPEAEMLYEEFENKLAGWGITFVITVPNDISIC
ncbi:MAG: hypothetical protein HQ473_07445 [Cryomorphaceae bacterium]|nr:hypothetical protein [Cryomorphaceae bacterium]